MKKILYMINPSSNEVQAMQLWEKARLSFPKLPKHPINLFKIPDLQAFLEKEKADIVVIAGGDGTINKVCQTVLALSHKPHLAVLPLGFGNALSYCLGVETIGKAYDVIQHTPDKVTIDVFKTTIPQLPLCVFTMGIGMDGRIVHKRMKDRYIGFRSYMLSAMWGILEHKKKQLTFTIDDTVTVKATASSLVITNAPIIGKNVIISEDAKLNDGYLKCILFSTKYAYVTNLRLRGFKHPLYSEENKMSFLAKHIRIEGDSFIQIDGDPVVTSSPVEITVVPKAITFLCNTKDNILLPTIPFV